MATSPLPARSPYAHRRRLFSISIRLLRLAHGVALAFLLRLFLSFLPQLSSLLNSVPIFLLANSLILAIVLSSASSSPSPPDNSSTLHSSHSQPLPREEEFGLPQHNKKQSLPTRQHSAAGPVFVVSANQFERPPVTLTRSSSFIPVSSLRNSPELPQKSGVAIAPDPLVEQMAIMQNYSNEELKKRLVVREPAQTKRFETASTAGDRNMIRSNCGPRICVGETVETVTNTIQRIDTIDSTPLELCCDGKSSSMIVIHVASFDSLVDDDLNKRCDEFIANSREKWKKECLEYGTN